MPTKTLSASLTPALYQRTRNTAREEGRKQSSVVAEALSLYTGLPPDVRQLLRDLDLPGSPGVAVEVAARLRSAVLEVRWQKLLERIRAATDPAVRARFEAMGADEADALARKAVRATRTHD
ncbi:MAG: hypothetical protein Q7J79_10420 [Gemmatimonadales bacterium]|nr:hypothetical protein [Gemmatimonadales bacterium]